jgi:hypothetical protein
MMMMKKSSVKPMDKTRQRSRTASEELVKSLSKLFPDKKVPLSALTGLSKKYGKKPIDPNSTFVKRLITDPKDPKSLNATKLTEYLSENTHFKRGQQLTDDAIKRAHAAFCNAEGRMTFEYILKRCEEIGVPISEKAAKGIVRKYGKRKDYLSAEDCIRVIHRRYANQYRQRIQTPKRSTSMRK